MKDFALGPAEGSLTLHTDVEGRAARMGHRLAILMTQWRGSAKFDGDDPAKVDLVVESDGIEVVKGEGGLKGLSSAERAMVRINALAALLAKQFPDISYSAPEIAATDQGFRLSGQLTIAGVTQDKDLDLALTSDEEAWLLTAETTVFQSDFGILAPSLFLGAMHVTDAVVVRFSARVPFEA